MNRKRTTLILAVLLALGTGLLTLNYLSSMRAASAAPERQREILVADKDIPARITVTAAMLRRVTRAESQVEPDAIADPRRAIGALALISIPAGASITASKVGRPSQVGLSVVLKPGMRAISIQVDKVKGVSGLIEPGDRVDVIAVPPRVGSEAPHAVTILRGALVLALGNALETAGATPAPDAQNVTTATLGVTPVQANLLSMADLNATLRLALRSPKEPIRSQPVETLKFAVAPGPAAVVHPTFAAAPPLPAVQAPSAASVPPRTQAARRAAMSSVIVIEGDKITGPSAP